MNEPAWHRPRTIAEALALRSELGEDALVVAGGTYIGVLLSTGLIAAPAAFISLRGVEELRALTCDRDGLRLGALVTHHRMECDAGVRAGGYTALADTFAGVANVHVGRLVELPLECRTLRGKRLRRSHDQSAWLRRLWAGHG